MHQLIEFFQPIDSAGYQIVEASGVRLGEIELEANRLMLLVEPTLKYMVVSTFERFDEDSFVPLVHFERVMKATVKGWGFENSEHWPEEVERGNVSALIAHAVKAFTEPTTKKVVIGRSGKVGYLPAHSDENFRDAFMSFAKASHTDAGVLAFVNRCGLTAKPVDGKTYGLAKDFPAMEFDAIVRNMKFVNSLIRHQASGHDLGDYLSQPMSRVHVLVSSNNDANAPRLVMAPDTLFYFMLLQFSVFVVANDDVEYYACENCNLHFSRGPGAERRLSAVYCSDKCRDAANYKKKKARRAANSDNEAVSA